MSDESAELTTGERIRLHRERAGLSRAVLAGLVGRSEGWLKKIEQGERDLRNVDMLVRIAQVLRLGDVGALTGTPGAMPVESWGKMSHAGVPALRDAIHASIYRRPVDLPTTMDELAGRVRQTWAVWHASPHQRTEVGALLPGLISACHTLVRGCEGADRRAAYRVMAETYALAQQYAAHTTEPELYWLTVDRARMAAEEADEPVTLAIAAWIAGNGLRDSGHADEALRLAADAAASLRPRLEDGTDLLRSTFGALCLHAAVTCAKEGREGETWRWWDEADRTARRLGAYAHPFTVFGEGNVAVHAVTLGVELRTPGAALRRLADVRPETIPSTERRSRLFVDAARSEFARRELAGALHYIKRAYETSPEAVRYVPPARGLVVELTRAATGPLRSDAVELAEAVGVAA
ncbi:helix-turn-helix domain-containing protein [Kitasatospora sp. NPDC127111]|uniref:helix-turn-helix domain-containing protein n=1 Tax=Kitasatospora sp. NPDC127111 TaxID=3345363 RepID=UPI00364064B1